MLFVTRYVLDYGLFINSYYIGELVFVYEAKNQNEIESKDILRNDSSTLEIRGNFLGKYSLRGKQFIIFEDV